MITDQLIDYNIFPKNMKKTIKDINPPISEDNIIRFKKRIAGMLELP